MDERRDKLIVKGLGALDGEYPFDIVGLISQGHPDTLTNREAHRVKEMSGVRAGELQEALEKGDNDVLVAFAAIVLTRAGKRFDEAVLWDAPMGAGIDFDIFDREEAAADPPAETQKIAAVPSEPLERPNGSSGGGSSIGSDDRASDPSPTGSPDSERSAISAPPTSVT